MGNRSVARLVELARTDLPECAEPAGLSDAVIQANTGCILAADPEGRSLMTARISARLNDETRATLERIQAQTGKSVTQLITEALDLYDQKLRNRVAGGKPGTAFAGRTLRRPAVAVRAGEGRVRRGAR